jgi:translation initiation factor IF-3
MINKKMKFDARESFVRVNERIKWSPVRVIDENGENLGVISTKDALSMARDRGLDLIEVSPKSRPPVCRIADYGKFKYEQSIREKKQKQSQKNSKLKEINLSPAIDVHDLGVKLNMAKKFLEAGQRVQFRLVFHKREMAHKDRGFEVMKKVVEELGTMGSATQPRLDGKLITCIVDPKARQ